MTGTTWNFQSKMDGSPCKDVRLELEWSVPEAAYFSDNYLPEDIGAGELLERWAKEHAGIRTLPIHWIITAPEILEKAPFCGEDEDFLSFYTHPWVPTRLLNFAELPVKDQTWRIGEDRGKAGFIQEATGWKPSPLQGSMDLGTVMEAWRASR